MIMLRESVCVVCCCCFFFQAEDGIRDLVRSRGLGDVYKRQDYECAQLERRILQERGIEFLAENLKGADASAGPKLSLIHI